MTPERIQRLRDVLAKRQPDLLLATDFVHKQRNLSALVRIADAVGIMRVHAVLGDEDYQAFRGTAMGSHHWVEVCRHRSLDEVLLPQREAGYQLVAAHLDDSSVDFRDVDYTRPTVIVMGAERQGLSDSGKALVDTCVQIPMMGMVGSLNVSVAAGVILSEAQRQRESAGLYSQCRVDRETYERLFFEWGHPQVRDYCREHRLKYPALNDEGEIDEPSDWYARVREGSADRWEGKHE